MVRFSDRLVPRTGEGSTPLSPDPFERFAEECQLRVTTEALPVTPRDILEPPAESDLYFLVTLGGPVADARPVRLIYTTPADDPTPPTVRDALWWLSSDAWAVERAAKGELERWAANHHFLAKDKATARLFAVYVRQADALQSLLGPSNYCRLLDLYEAEIKAPGHDTRREPPPVS